MPTLICHSLINEVYIQVLNSVFNDLSVELVLLIWLFRFLEVNDKPTCKLKEVWVQQFQEGIQCVVILFYFL